ncbi:hypothetical protein DYB31_009715 [Aphanomyces astaci]|uniref:Calmodulin n=1 Tax=Aphanomyces astaci TaxID=112090 RepID=A0A397FDC1_APHAT|nr:hypothetical protein DYB31_009715 [Aphanomyces astaci]
METLERLLLTADSTEVNATTVHNRRRVTAMEQAMNNGHWEVVHMLWAHPSVADDSRDKVAHDTIFPIYNASAVVLEDNPGHSFTWAAFVHPDLPVADDVSKVAVVAAMLNHPSLHAVPRADVVRRLMTSTDQDDRAAIDMADKLVREYLTSQQYFLTRYELVDGPPVHVSATAVVLLAIDHGIFDQVFDEYAGDDGCLDLNGFNSCNITLGRVHADSRGHKTDDQDWQAEFDVWDKDNDESMSKAEFHRYCDQTFGNKLKVVLKFMKSDLDCARERSHRSRLDTAFILGLLPPPEYDAADIATLRLPHHPNVNMAEYANLVVMPAADRSLEDIFLKERPSEAQVIDMIKQVAAALDHLHSHRIVHGDLKKLNVLRMGVHLKLIDLDASTRIGDALGAKFSSGILPPGCMLFQLLSGEELVPTDVNQDVTADYIDAAATWTDAKLHMRIHSQVPNEFAQNLLKQLLLVDPTARVSAAEVLAHPFLTGQRGKNHQAVLENVALVHQTQRNAQATLHALVDAHQNTEQLLEQLGHLTAQLSSLKLALLRGYFDAAEATVPTSFVVVRDRPSCVTSSDMDMLVASSATALLACVRSVALRTVHGSTITQALAVLTNGQPLYLYLVDEVSGEVVVGGDDGGMRRGGVYPIPIHPSDTSLLTSMLPLLVGGLKVLAHERRGRYVDNATRTWMEDALDMIMKKSWECGCLKTWRARMPHTSQFEARR